MTERKFYKTTVTTVVLSEGPYEFTNLNNLDYDILAGDCSGRSTSTSEEISSYAAAKELLKQGSDSSFFQLDQDGVDCEDINEADYCSVGGCDTSGKYRNLSCIYKTVCAIHMPYHVQYCESCADKYPELLKKETL